MCGIFGYCGEVPALPQILRALTILEYRGYDSSGLACMTTEGQLALHKSAGSVAVLTDALAKLGTGSQTQLEAAKIGIGHTRWATHGSISEINAHPHLCYNGKLALVHNGIIENYTSLKKELEEHSINIKSETDTEIIAHLISQAYERTRSTHTKKGPHLSLFLQALKDTCKRITGTYALLMLHRDFPQHIIATLRGASLLISKNEEGVYVSSDQQALSAVLKECLILEDEEIAVSNGHKISVEHARKGRVKKSYTDFSPYESDIQKGEYQDFMLKEIHEHPLAVAQALAGRIHDAKATALLSGLGIDEASLRNIGEVKILSMGTSYYAGLIGASCIESLAHIPASAEMAAEFILRNPVIRNNVLYLIISQSGETYDSIKALQFIQSRGVKAYGICNVVGSRIARESDGGCYTHSGPEIAVASTKVFSGQLSILFLLALRIARIHSLSFQEGSTFIQELRSLPSQLASILNCSSLRQELRTLAAQYKRQDAFIFLGKGLSYPLALEAALKLKETSYVHASGYSSAELKHGPIALIEKEFPCMLFDNPVEAAEKTLSSIKEIHARDGHVIVVTAAHSSLAQLLKDAPMSTTCLSIPIPTTHNPYAAYFAVFSHTLIAHLFAYYSTKARTLPVDKPRNLAKSVTVE